MADVGPCWIINGLQPPYSDTADEQMECKENTVH